MPVELEPLKTALEIRKIIGAIDRFFIAPTPENQERALRLGQALPDAIERYGALRGVTKSAKNGSSRSQRTRAKR